MTTSNTALTGDQSAGRLQLTQALTVAVPGTALDAVAGKTLKDTADALAITVNLKAPQSAVDALTQTVSTKAPQSAVDTLTAGKADKATTDALALTAAAKVPSTAIGAASGVAPLDGTGKVPAQYLPASSGGDVPAVQQAHTVVIPLDLAGEGRGMPAVASNLTKLDTAFVYTIAPGAVLNGLCIDNIVTTGLGSIAFDPSITVVGKDVNPVEIGRAYQLRFWNLSIGVVVLIVKGALFDITPPLVQTSHIEAADHFTVLTPVADAGVVSMLGQLSDVTLGGADAGSFTKVSQAFVNGVHQLVLSGGFNATGAVNGTQLTTAFAAGFFRDNATPTNNLSLARAATPVVINIPVGVPNAPTLTAGTATSTAQPLTITPGATDAGHGAAASFETQYSADNGQTWNPGVSDVSTTPTIGSLTLATAYKYRSRGINPTGPGAWSVVISSSTAAGVADPSVVAIYDAVPGGGHDDGNGNYTMVLAEGDGAFFFGWQANGQAAAGDCWIEMSYQNDGVTNSMASLSQGPNAFDYNGSKYYSLLLGGDGQVRAFVNNAISGTLYNFPGASGIARLARIGSSMLVLTSEDGGFTFTQRASLDTSFGKHTGKLTHVISMGNYADGIFIRHPKVFGFNTTFP